jgi:AhpD family alkylhydroperoxidase
VETRINLYEKNPGILKALYGLNAALAKTSLDESLLNLVHLRASQINGCAFCIDMHAKDLRAEGETEQRIYMLDAWREAPFYDERERAALAWTEAVTLVADGHVPNSVYDEVTSHFTDVEVTELTFAIAAVNVYNRLNIAFRTPAGNYKVGQFKTAAAATV